VLEYNEGSSCWVIVHASKSMSLHFEHDPQMKFIQSMGLDSSIKINFIHEHRLLMVKKLIEKKKMHLVSQFHHTSLTKIGHKEEIKLMI
jgi:hypothetical protein